MAKLKSVTGGLLRPLLCTPHLHLLFGSPWGREDKDRAVCWHTSNKVTSPLRRAHLVSGGREHAEDSGLVSRFVAKTLRSYSFPIPPGAIFLTLFNHSRQSQGIFPLYSATAKAPAPSI